MSNEAGTRPTMRPYSVAMVERVVVWGVVVVVMVVLMKQWLKGTRVS